jgi:hypothetical protein
VGHPSCYTSAGQHTGNTTTIGDTATGATIENLRPREAAEKTAEHTSHGGHAYTRIR